MRLIFFVLLIFLTSCATTPQQSLRKMSPPLSALPGPVKLRQKLTVKSDKINQSFEAVLSYDAQILKLVALTTMGSVLFSMEYDGKVLKTAQQRMKKLAQQVLSDLVLASLNKAKLKQYLPQGVSFQDTEKTRVLFSGTNELVKVTYSKRKKWPRHFKLVRDNGSYELHVRTLEEL